MMTLSAFDIALREQYLSLYIAQHQYKFPAELQGKLTIGAHLGDGVYELVDYKHNNDDGPIVVGLFVAPGVRVGTIQIDNIDDRPVVSWQMD